LFGAAPRDLASSPVAAGRCPLRAWLRAALRRVSFGFSLYDPIRSI
jgi:hypothetical protein